MRRRTREEWRQLFAEFDASGEAVASFCEARNMSAAYFVKRRRQLQSSRTGFVPVRVGASTGRVMIQVDDVSIRCEADVPVNWLRELVSALRQ